MAGRTSTTPPSMACLAGSLDCCSPTSFSLAVCSSCRPSSTSTSAVSSTTTPPGTSTTAASASPKVAYSLSPPAALSMIHVTAPRHPRTTRAGVSCTLPWALHTRSRAGRFAAPTARTRTLRACSMRGTVSVSRASRLPLAGTAATRRSCDVDRGLAGEERGGVAVVADAEHHHVERGDAVAVVLDATRGWTSRTRAPRPSQVGRVGGHAVDAGGGDAGDVEERALAPGGSCCGRRWAATARSSTQKTLDLVPVEAGLAGEQARRRRAACCRPTGRAAARPPLAMAARSSLAMRAAASRATVLASLRGDELTGDDLGDHGTARR